MLGRRLRRVLSIGASLLAIAGQVAPVHASSQPAATWATPVRWFFSTTGSPYTEAEFVPVITQAMNHWSAATGNRLQFVYQGTTTATTRCGVGGTPGTDDQYIVGWNANLGGAAGFGCFGTDGVNVTRGDINLYPVRYPNQVWFYLVLHEIGHTLGFSHNHDPSSIMNVDGGNVGNIDLGNIDLNRVASAYGAPVPPVYFSGGSDAVGSASPAQNAYFAEGYTGLGVHEYLTIENPNPLGETVDVTFELSNGTVIVQHPVLGAYQRTTIYVNSVVGPDQSVSIAVHAQTGTIVAERPMYFYYFPGQQKGGHDVVGTSAPGLDFYFAEGTTIGGVDEWLTIQNPNSVPATIQITYYTPQGARAPIPVTIPAASRFTEHVNADVPNSDVSIRVHSLDQPVLAERPMYFTVGGRSGGSVVIGASAPQTDLYLAEGFASPNFDEWITLLNPGTVAAAATIDYFLTDGTMRRQPVGISAGQRVTVHVNDVLPSAAPGTSSSVHIHSTAPIVAERPMYFDRGAGLTGGHDAMAVGAASLGFTQNFAEGYTGPGYDEWLTILNTGQVASCATITYLPESGSGPIKKAVSLLAGSRTSVHVNEQLGPNIAAGVIVSTVPDTAAGACGLGFTPVPILVERPMYFSYLG